LRRITVFTRAERQVVLRDPTGDGCHQQSTIAQKDTRLQISKYNRTLTRISAGDQLALL
jgi:hypothetical protein